MFFIKRYKKAMTLAEIMLTFAIVGIIATVTSNIINNIASNKMNQYMTYSAFTNLKQVVAEVLSADSDKTLDASGPTLCDLVVDLFNTVGTVARTNVAADGTVKTATPNFVTTNGMKFYNFGTNAASGLFTIYVDIDGPRRSTTLNDDVIKFTINTNGEVLPAYNSIAATDKKYLSAAVRSTSGGTVSWVLPATDFRTAYCSLNAVNAAKTYCTAAPAKTANATCTTVGNTCDLVINKPKELIGFK